MNGSPKGQLQPAIRIGGLASAFLLVAGCGVEVAPNKQVQVPATWRVVDVGLISRFPVDRKIDGHDNLCGAASADPQKCVLFDEGPVLTHRTGTFTLRSRDDYGDTGPAPERLDPGVRFNGRTVYRSAAADGTISIVVTASSGGPNAAALLWLKPTDALLWMTCRAAPDCLLAEQVAGSTIVKSAASRNFASLSAILNLS